MVEVVLPIAGQLLEFFTEALPARVHGGRLQRPVQVRPFGRPNIFGQDDAAARADPHGDLHRQQDQLQRVRLRIGETGQQVLGLRVELLLGVALEQRHQFGGVVFPEGLRAHADAAPESGQAVQEVRAGLQFGRLDSRECLF